MPLAFHSVSHGTVAFGFFNIESDMLLLETYFFFAQDFCDILAAYSASPDAGTPEGYSLEGHTIDRPEDIGDLMGAIHGIRHTGFIGEIYRLFPFPKKPEAFRQNPDGYKTRKRVSQVIGTYGKPLAIPVGQARDQTVYLGDYRFDIPSFQALINYVWQGGYPRWNHGIRPGYVLAMRKSVEQSLHPVFRGTRFEE